MIICIFVMIPYNPTLPRENVHSTVCLYYLTSLVCLLGNILQISSLHPFLSCLKAQLRQMQRSGWHLLHTLGCDTDLPRVPHPLFPLHVLCIQHVICSCSFGQPRSFLQMQPVSNEKHVWAEYGTTQDYLSGLLGHADWSCDPTHRFWYKLARERINMLGFLCEYHGIRL